MERVVTVEGEEGGDSEVGSWEKAQAFAVVGEEPFSGGVHGRLAYARPHWHTSAVRWSWHWPSHSPHPRHGHPSVGEHVTLWR